MIKDKRPYHVFVFKCDSVTIEHTVRPKAPTLEELQKIVGGYVKTVPFFKRIWLEGGKYLAGGVAMCDEDGRRKYKAFNVIATRMWREQYQQAEPLVGDVVFYVRERK